MNLKNISFTNIGLIALLALSFNTHAEFTFKEGVLEKDLRLTIEKMIAPDCAVSGINCPAINDTTILVNNRNLGVTDLNNDFVLKLDGVSVANANSVGFLFTFNNEAFYKTLSCRYLAEQYRKLNVTSNDIYEYKCQANTAIDIGATNDFIGTEVTSESIESGIPYTVITTKTVYLTPTSLYNGLVTYTSSITTKTLKRPRDPDIVKKDIPIMLDDLMFFVKGDVKIYKPWAESSTSTPMVGIQVPLVTNTPGVVIGCSNTWIGEPIKQGSYIDSSGNAVWYYYSDRTLQDIAGGPALLSPITSKCNDGVYIKVTNLRLKNAAASGYLTVTATRYLDDIGLWQTYANVLKTELYEKANKYVVATSISTNTSNSAYEIWSGMKTTSDSMKSLFLQYLAYNSVDATNIDYDAIFYRAGTPTVGLSLDGVYKGSIDSNAEALMDFRWNNYRQDTFTLYGLFNYQSLFSERKKFITQLYNSYVNSNLIGDLKSSTNTDLTNAVNKSYYFFSTLLPAYKNQLNAELQKLKTDIQLKCAEAGKTC